MSVSEIKTFLIGAESGFYYSGIRIEQSGINININDLSGSMIPDTVILTVGTNDYIPAVHDNYFPENGDIQSFTTAEALIYFLENINNQVDYPGCDHYFRYQYGNQQ